MSCTICNKAVKDHETAKRAAMDAYPYGHSARFAVWEEYSITVIGGDSFHMSEWAITPIWRALVANGWDKGTAMFPCSGMKRLALIYALNQLMDKGVEEATPCTKLLNAFNSMEGVVGFNTQTTLEALTGLIAFVESNDEVFTF